VILATNASPSQGTLVIAPEKAPTGMLAVVIVRNRKTGDGAHAASDTFTPHGSDAKCGYECHSMVAAKDYIFRAYPKR
jgi:hypothetical protein